MNYITLPSGLAINLDQVAYIQKSKDAGITVTFPALAAGARAAGSLFITMPSEDEGNFLSALKQKGVTLP
jgi:hypothetical protein